MELLVKPEPLSINDNITENWKIFESRWSNYCIGVEINKKSDAVQVAVFLNLIGSEAEELINSLDLSAEKQSSVAALILSIDEYVKPKTNTVFCRYQFFTRDQKEGEYFETFLLALKKLAEP